MPRITRSKSSNENASDSSQKVENVAKKMSSKPKEHPKQIVSMVPSVLVDGDRTKFTFVSVPHPRTNHSVLVVLGDNDKSLFEVNTFIDGKRSWFIGDSVEPEGKLHILTPLDPVFLVLPYLIKAERLSPVDQTLLDDKYPNLRRIVSCTNLNLEVVADRKGSAELQVFKYNEDKTLKWLERKVQQVTKSLESRGVNVSSGSCAATFVKSSNSNPEHVLQFAFGMLSEYLPPDLNSKLAEHMGIELLAKVPNARQDGGPAAKKAKIEPTEDYSQNGKNLLAKAKPANAKEKARSEAAKGSKNIMSFFGKK